MLKLDVIGNSKIWLSLSAISVLLSVILVIVYGLNFGIDFTGGTLMDVQFIQEVSSDDVRNAFSEIGYSSTVQSGENGYVVRIEHITEEQHSQILTSLETKFGEVTENRYETIGSVVGQELKLSSIKAVIIVLLLIGLYIAWAFRKVSDPIKSWKYGVITIIAAFHDVVIPLGAFAILGHFYGYEVNTAFIAALLTIMGYSINDTIVVFDRTRENLANHRFGSKSFSELVNLSIVQTFARSINTSFTTILALIAVLIFGGETTRPFVLALIIGIATGTYSSIFVASPLLVYWEKWKNNRE
jgi:preprotein translocase subunit SecF